ncbi:MAG TPA: response regulator, partial [Urbifossiella sp.]|nr:response regulator [Urbifossiella sp.]
MRIAIVNDLGLAREVLRRVVLSVPGYVVAWEAVDGEDAVAKAAADRPDAILMDLVMPRLDGAEATRRIMRQSPCPVLVVTSTVNGNFELVYRAMGAGALDAVETPTLGPGGVPRNAEPLVARLTKLDAALQGQLGSGFVAVPAVKPPSVDVPRIVGIGVSTGG